MRRFLVSLKAGPLLTLSEPSLGTYQFQGPDMNYIQHDLPPGVPLNFSWNAETEDYGAEIRSFRYGWDIQQLDDPSQWAVDPSPFIKAAETKTFYSGIHRFLIEVVESIRRILGPKFPIMVRLTGEELFDGGYRIDFTQKVAMWLENAGVDEINISAGNYEEWGRMIAPPAVPEGFLANDSAAIKDVVKIPVGVGGRIARPTTAEKIVEKWKADLGLMKLFS